MVYLTVLRIHKIAGGKGQRLSLIAFSDIVTTRHSTSKLDFALAAPLIAFSDIVATRQSSSKLDSALAAPLIPASEPESHPCYSPQEIPDQVRDEWASPQ